ncbi:MAG: NADH-quinone oxidoreductase subunit M [Planctomycetaceae bacterium]|nr:NADH-quinone oxidoreductase subunit M [Planctomycetaceae bacterium]
MFQLSQIPFLMVTLPLAGALVLLLTARFGIEHVRRTALMNVLLTFAVAVVMVVRYDPDRVDDNNQPQLIQMAMVMPWVGSPGAGPDIRFALGIDGISLWLIALSALLMIPAVLVSWEAVQDRPAAFYALMLVLEAGLIGVFAAQDIILFYVFFEFTLIPLFFMVGIWGGQDRRWAARKFFIYTLAGSVLTFLGLIAVVLSYSWMSGNSELTFSIPALTQGISQQLAVNPEAQAYWAKASPWIFLALFAGFAIKVPLFPFHTWLPLAHVEAPTAGSVLLAGVLLKIGSYGFLRFALPLVPEACFRFFDFVSILAVIGIIYGALLALAQDDIKKLVAYSSVSHMGFCLLGLFALNSVGITGGLLQMINHGLSTGALFAIVGMLYERYHTRDIQAYHRMAKKYPVMAFILLIVVFSSIGLPGLNGFTGEILALMGMFKSNWLYAVLSLSGIILGAWYMLWLVQRTFFGRLREPGHEGHGHAASGLAAHDAGDYSSESALTDLNVRELCALVPVVVLIAWIGIYPQYFIRRMEPSISQVMRQVDAGFQRYEQFRAVSQNEREGKIFARAENPAD